MKPLLACLLLLPLTNCAVYIPGSVTTALLDSAEGKHGNYCVPSTSEVGQQIALPHGGTGTITKIEGKSWRCKEAAKPMRAYIQ